MDTELLRILSDELREGKNLMVGIRKKAEAANEKADQAIKLARDAWELTVITRNQFQESIAKVPRPWWQRIL